VLNIAVVGSQGKMGSAICDAVEGVDDLRLVARIGHGDQLKAVLDTGADVLVDVTNATAAVETLAWSALHGMKAVVGTSGFDQQQLGEFDSAFRRAGAPCLLVPNFSMTAVLMMRFAEQAAQYLPDVEIIELHRAEKPDAPSGTAVETARRIAGRRTGTPVVTDRESPTRGEMIDGVPVHAVRLPGLLAQQQVCFGAPGEGLVIRHDCTDRVAFMPGVLRAVRGVGDLPAGLTIGLDAVL
jgi:4-hydroxy-tetrahydrodipicolinate reductase